MMFVLKKKTKEGSKNNFLRHVDTNANGKNRRGGKKMKKRTRTKGISGYKYKY